VRPYFLRISIRYLVVILELGRNRLDMLFIACLECSSDKQDQS
jgi:hypothetical protein